MKSRTIRVLQVVPNMQQGGIENFIMNVYRQLDREKIQFDFLEHYGSDHYFDNEIRSLGGSIYRIPFMDGKMSLTAYMRELSTLFQSHSQVWSAVHGHMATTAYCYLRAAKKAGICNRIVHAHEDSYLLNPRGILRMLLIKQAWRNATCLLACSQKSGTYYFGKKQYSVINNGIDVKRFKYNESRRKAIRSELAIAEDALVVGHIGRFDEQKNHRYLIEVFKEIKTLNDRAELLLIGNGTLLPLIKDIVEKNSLSSSVHFIGNTSTPEDFYSAMDVFTLPSFFEGLPLTGIEAQSNGLPCVFSSAVSRDVDLGSKVIFCDLSADANSWAKNVISAAREGRNDAADAQNRVRMAGYDAASSARRLAEIYRGDSQ